MKNFRYLPHVTSLKYDEEICVGCGVCLSVCPHGVFEENGRKVKTADLNGCMECGACALNCPADAIQVSPGVGCASYIIKTWIKGKDAAASSDSGCC